MVLEQKQKISYELLNEDFYRNFRNEVNEKRLTELSKLAEEIGEQNSYGQYSSPADYLKALKITLGATLETRHRSIFLWRKILPLLKSKTNFIDVGIGDGKSTRLIGSEFKQTTVIDTNQIAIDSFPLTLRNRTKVTKICASILDTSLQNNYYDFSLLSHTLYYIDFSEWANLISKLYNATKPGGIILIVLGGDAYGKAELIDFFGGKPPATDWLFQKCCQLFTREQVRGFCSKETFISKNILEMLHISGFLLYDAGVIATKEALTKYINKHFKRDDNSFCMTTQQKFILIHKS